jgi:uncharacterized protein (UPF0276 family)
MLAPDAEWLRLCAPLFGLVDSFSISPETTWRGAALERNGFAEGFLDIVRSHGAQLVGHGVAFSLGSENAGDRQSRWLRALRRDHAVHPFAWYTDHLGVTLANGEDLQLPVPVPLTSATAARTRASLDRLASLFDAVGAENSAWYFHPSDAMDEPAWIVDALGESHHLLLDVHNLYTSSINLGFDAYAWLAKAPLDRVIEIHLSGGSEAPPAWTGGRRIRLDSHDADVPNEVWQLFDDVWPACQNLRAVTLERIEGSVLGGDVPRLRDTLVRIKETVA